MEREDSIKIVSDGLSALAFRLHGRSAAGLTDLSSISEDFFKDFLNDLRGLALVNLNVATPNHPAVDLGDKQKRVSFQVTMDRSTKKIKESAIMFLGHQLGQDYDEIFFVILRQKQKTYPKFSVGTVQVNPDRHIVDIYDLIKEARNASPDTLKHLRQLIAKENLLPAFACHDSDEVAFGKIYSEFDCNALKHSWHQEGHAGDFESRLIKLTELLGEGTIGGKTITKPLYEFTDKSLMRELFDLRDALGELRALFNHFANTQEINRQYGSWCFKDPRSADNMNGAKQKVLDAINQIGRRYNLRAIAMTRILHS